MTNPKVLIHQYATTTPVQTIPGYESLPDGGITRSIKESYSSRTEETYSPYPPYTGGVNSVNPNKFVRQLRDDSEFHRICTIFKPSTLFENFTTL